MLRSILHCDMNNFYASVECMLDPALKKYPIAVCGSVEERHGIVLAKNYKAMFLFFDRKKRFKKGRLSCYINTAGDDRPKYRVSDKNIDGYKHLGRLVLTLRNYEE